MPDFHNSVISFCIPTKNFGSYISGTIDSIVNQGDLNVEIIIVDGGSSDNTRQIVEAKMLACPLIKYYFLEEAGGVDADLELAIQKATGEYVWLLSADDHLVSDAIVNVRRALEHGPIVILTNRVECDTTLSPLYKRHWLSKSAQDLLVDFTDRRQVLDYYRAASSIGALFSYISSIVVHRSTYIKTPRNKLFFGTNYQHAYILLTMLKQAGTLKYLRRPLIMCRGGNDSFLTQTNAGVVKRFLIDFNGYYLIQREICIDDPILADAFSTAIRREHGPFNLIRLAIRVPTDREWAEIVNTLRRLNYRTFVLSLVSFFRRAELILGLFTALRSFRRRLRANTDRV